MRSPWKRAAAVALATAAVSALPLINGCKTSVEKADEKVSADLDTATVAMSNLRPETAREAVGNSNAKGGSTDAQIQAHVAAAQADLQAANLIMCGPGASNASAMAFRAVVDGKAQSSAGSQNLTPDERANLQGIEQRQMRVAQLLSVMTSVGGQVTLNNIGIAGSKALDPVKAREALQKATGDAQKGDNGVWVAGAAPLSALDALKAREAELQKQIADFTSQRNDLNTKRGQSLEGAGKFSQQADASTGAQSVGFFTQASNQRKEAADDEVRIAQVDAQIKPLQQDLNLVQGQEKALADIIASYGTQAQQVESSWQEVQRRIGLASGYSNDLLQKAEPPAPAQAPADATGGAMATTAVIAPMPHSLAGLATELDAQVREVQSLRKKAVELLTSAYTHYDQALGLASTLTKTLTAQSTGADAAKLPEKRAWQERIALNSPAGFKLRQAAVQTALAGLYSDQYAELAQRNRVAALLTAAIKQAGLTAPPALATALPAEAAIPPDVDSQLKNTAGDLKSDQPPFDKDAKALAELAAGQTSPMGQQGIAAAQADLAYQWAKNLLTDVVNNAGQSDIAPLLVNIAHAALMPNYYAQAQFALLQGKDQEAKSDMAAALEERKTLVDANAQNLLPGELPEGLAFEVKSVGVPNLPSSAPATMPAGTSSPTVSAQGGPDQQEILRITNEFFDDLIAGQVDKAMALSLPDPRLSPTLQLVSDEAAAASAYKAAIRAKFGDEVANHIPDVRPDLTSAQVAIDGNHATVNHATINADIPNLVTLTKGDAGWKIDPPTDAQMQPFMQLKPTVEIYKSLIPNIQAGKYTTVDELIKDVQAKAQAAGIRLPADLVLYGGVPTATRPAEPTTQATTTPLGGTTPPPDATTAPSPGTTPPAK
jgi:hypothetical protein